jgi:hypothetical protein
VSDIDYSKPVGWWCALSGETFANGAEHAIMCDHRAFTLGTSVDLFMLAQRRLIPVFAPLPVPEPCVASTHLKRRP